MLNSVFVVCVKVLNRIVCVFFCLHMETGCVLINNRQEKSCARFILDVVTEIG